MGGVIGATSGKFVLMATSLLLHGRIDGTDIRVAIVPGAQTSALSMAAEARIRARSGKPEVTIGLRAESFQARRDTLETTPAFDADLRIGQDLLSEHPVEIDFKHHEIQPLLPGEARHFERTSIAIPVRREADGTLSVDLTLGDHATIRAKLDLSSATGVTASRPEPATVVRVGPARLSGIDMTEGSEPVVGLYAFRSARVIFDLGHDRIWIRS